MQPARSGGKYEVIEMAAGDVKLYAVPDLLKGFARTHNEGWLAPNVYPACHHAAHILVLCDMAVRPLNPTLVQGSDRSTQDMIGL